MATCTDCGHPFDDQGKSYRQRCYPCWQDHRATLAEWRARALRAEGELGRADLQRLRWELRAGVAEDRLRELERQVMDGDGRRIPADILQRLIRLCHPDKHRSSQAATEATQWLLRQRRAS